MPQDLPGFYYDTEKNRYFPIKGPIPGSSRASSSSSNPPSLPVPGSETFQTSRTRTTKRLLQDRESYGNVIKSNKGKYNFQQEYYKRQASKPKVWKYTETERTGDGGLEYIHVDKQTPTGLAETSFLIAGSTNSSLSLLEVGKASHTFEYAMECRPDPVWPLDTETQRNMCSISDDFWRPIRSSMYMPSNISSVISRTVDNPACRHALITILGSDTAAGTLYLLNFNEPLDSNPSNHNMRQRMYEVSSFKYTIWTAACNPDGSKAIVGCNLGAQLVNLETGCSSWVYRSKSDILSQQFDRSGNVVLCGLRNGAIMTVDVREKHGAINPAKITRCVEFPKEPSKSSGRNIGKKWFKFKGSVDTSSVVFMPSSISCLVYLQSYDQYFLASSMDGSINLYDHRMMERGAVQSYEGHVNSHSRLQLRVDPSERFLMSGGEDCKLRIWSIKSGELLFAEKISDSPLLTVCWPRTERYLPMHDEKQLHGISNCWDAWLGSREGLFYMNWT